MRILGLDVSTSIIGYAILDSDELSGIVEIGHIDFSKCNDFWEKVDFARKRLTEIISKHKPEKTYIEESLMGFSSGLSSAGTLFTLAKFNALVTFFVREEMNETPVYISAGSARKSCGIKLLQKKKCGLSHKEQTFNWMLAGPLSTFEFPKGRTGKFKSFAYDEVDGFVIALAATKINKTAI